VSTITLDKVRSRNPLLPLAQRRMKLRQGGRTWIGCCPFHDEKTASFMVYPDHRFYCFGCGAHGDVIDFIRRMDGLTFREARDRRAAEGGLSPTAPPREQPKSGQDRTESDKAANLHGQDWGR
jgi:DNA primase